MSIRGHRNIIEEEQNDNIRHSAKRKGAFTSNKDQYLYVHESRNIKNKTELTDSKVSDLHEFNRNHEISRGAGSQHQMTMDARSLSTREGILSSNMQEKKKSYPNF